MPESRRLDVYCTGPDAVVPLARPLHLPVTTGEVQVLFATLEEHRTRIPMLEALLDVHEQDRAQRFRFAKDRERYIIGHGLLRIALGEALAMPPEAVPFQRGTHGKPFVPGSALEFNLSDTKDAVLLALTTGMAVGADIETMDRETDHERVGAHYFAPREMAGIVAGDAGKRRFLELWTRKEAVLKASGVGIMEDLRALHVDQAQNALTIAHPEFVRMAAAAYHVRTLAIGERHLISIATPSPVERVALLRFTR